MTTLAALADSAIDVNPGQPAALMLTVRNTGDVVEGYRLTVVGPAAAWSTVEPPELNLYPGTDGQARVVFDPPRTSDVPAGDVPFAVTVTPSEHPGEAVAPEGVARVLPFTATTAELVPRTIAARLFGRAEVAVDNRGNVPVRVRVEARDADRALRFESRPEERPAEPGEAVFTKLAVRARKPRWRGQPVTRPYAVAVETLDGRDHERVVHDPVVLDGTLVQRPVIPKRAPRWAAALLALALLAVAGWFFLLKPAVESAAENAVAAPMEEMNDKVAAADQKAGAAQEAAEGAAEAAASGAPGDGSAEGTEDTATTPFATRLETTTNADATGTDAHTVGEDTTFGLTDIVLENPQGDTGRLDIEVNGDLLFTVSLANFRDLDYHFVSPISVPAGETIVMRVTCQEPGPRLVGTDSDACRTIVVLTGTNTKETEA